MGAQDAMSLPQNQPAALSLPGPFIPPDDQVSRATEDFEDGGVAVQDASQGLVGFTWRLWVNGLEVWLQREGAAVIPVFTAAGIEELSLAFDQNMRPHVAYSVGGTLYLRWYDSFAQAYVTSSFGPGKNPRLSLDDKRYFMISASDVIFAYLRNGSLCYRQQRDRFEVERVLRTGIADNIKLKNIGMSKNLRMQFELV
jgi:hypothetical protein